MTAASLRYQQNMCSTKYGILGKLKQGIGVSKTEIDFLIVMTDLEIH